MIWNLLRRIGIRRKRGLQLYCNWQRVNSVDDIRPDDDGWICFGATWDRALTMPEVERIAQVADYRRAVEATAPDHLVCTSWDDD